MRRVLVVDNEPHIRTVLCGYLEADGFAVVEAADGETALQAVHAGQPDLVLLDVMLPGIDGLEVTAEPGNSQPDHARGCASRGRGLPFLGGRADCPSSFLRQLQLLKESPGASLHGRPQYQASDTGSLSTRAAPTAPRRTRPICLCRCPMAFTTGITGWTNAQARSSAWSRLRLPSRLPTCTARRIGWLPTRLSRCPRAEERRPLRRRPDGPGRGPLATAPGIYGGGAARSSGCLLYTSPSPRD